MGVKRCPGAGGEIHRRGAEDAEGKPGSDLNFCFLEIQVRLGIILVSPLRPLRSSASSAVNAAASAAITGRANGERAKLVASFDVGDWTVDELRSGRVSSPEDAAELNVVTADDCEYG